MAELSDFVGTWRAEKGAPLSSHTFMWENTASGLRGRWIIEAPDMHPHALRASTAAQGDLSFVEGRRPSLGAEEAS